MKKVKVIRLKIEITSLCFIVAIFLLSSCASRWRGGSVRPRGYFVEETTYLQTYPAPIAPLPHYYQDSYHHVPVMKGGTPMPSPNCGRYPSPYPMYYQ